MDISTLIEQKLNHYAKSIEDGSAKVDEHALGEMTFCMALRRVLLGKATPQDIGMMDAVNDILQQKGIVAQGATFYK